MKKVGRRAEIIAPCHRCCLICGTSAEVRGIGNTAVKTGRVSGAKTAQIRAYTLQAGVEVIASDIFQCGFVGSFRDFQTGYGTAAVFCAQQQSQRAAAGAKVQHLCISGELYKMCQQHGIGA